ncbi:MAG TPA: GIY-YIG nuclease family protein [Agriterribacter sp.]|nr:GIY-YIG nuclease family protein [Chitinophagaceae bacterium]HRP32151.1 GIY-YIG nuclease family protein [Agriterribacter sp.]
MHDVYILYSSSFDRYYTGESVNARMRTIQHNSSFYVKASTSFATDWELVLVLSLEDRSSALKVERYIKAMKSKVFIRKLVLDTGFREEFKSIVAKKFGVRIH